MTCYSKFGLGWLGATLCFLATGATAKPLSVGSEAPIFYLATLNEKASGTKRVVLERLVGPRAEKPKAALWLVFFDADCQPCRRLLPELQTLRNELAACGLEVIGVDCDSHQEKIEEVARLLQELSVSFPVVVDRFGALIRRYQVESFPTFFLLDQKRKILEVQEGFHPHKKPVPLDALRKLLGLPTGTPKCPSSEGGKK